MKESLGRLEQAKRDCLGREKWRLTCCDHPLGEPQLLEEARCQREVDVDMIGKSSEWKNYLKIYRLI